MAERRRHAHGRRRHVRRCSQAALVKKYYANEKNQIELRTDPILVQKDGTNLLIDSGIGLGKLTDKQNEITESPKNRQLMTR